MTALAFLVAWVGALAAWVAYIEWIGHEPWSAEKLTGALLLFGAPLVITVPFLHLPALRWLSGRSMRSLWRQVLVVATSGLLLLPLVYWPFLLGGGKDWREMFVWHLRHFFVLYGTFGLLFGLWYAIVRTPRGRPPL